MACVGNQRSKYEGRLIDIDVVRVKSIGIVVTSMRAHPVRNREPG